MNTEERKDTVRIVEGLLFVNTENRNHGVRIVEGLLYVNQHFVILMEINVMMDIA